MAQWWILKNRQVDGFVELVDLMPTFLEAAGLEVPSAVQGKVYSLYFGGEENDFVENKSMLNIIMHGRTVRHMVRCSEPRIGKLWYTMEPIRVNFMI